MLRTCNTPISTSQPPSRLIRRERVFGHSKELTTPTLDGSPRRTPRDRVKNGSPKRIVLTEGDRPLSCRKMLDRPRPPKRTDRTAVSPSMSSLASYESSRSDLGLSTRGSSPAQPDHLYGHRKNTAASIPRPASSPLLSSSRPLLTPLRSTTANDVPFRPSPSWSLADLEPPSPLHFTSCRYSDTNSDHGPLNRDGAKIFGHTSSPLTPTSPSERGPHAYIDPFAESPSPPITWIMVDPTPSSPLFTGRGRDIFSESGRNLSGSGSRGGRLGGGIDAVAHRL